MPASSSVAAMSLELEDGVATIILPGGDATSAPGRFLHQALQGPDIGSAAVSALAEAAVAMSAEAAVAASASAAVAASAQDLAGVQITQSFKLNNVALKWIRDSHEDPPGHPTTDCVDLTGSDPYEIGVIERHGGMEYQFVAGRTQPWSWRQMLAAMSAQAKELLLGSNPTLGVVRITCEPVTGSYDHKRWHAALAANRPYDNEAAVPVWDFFLTRSDGTTVRFHTNLTNNKVEVARVRRAQENHPEVARVDKALENVHLPTAPLRGKGKSDGKGTYKRKTSGNYDTSVRSSQTHHGGGDGGGDGGGGDGGGDGSAVAEPQGRWVWPRPRWQGLRVREIDPLARLGWQGLGSVSWWQLWDQKPGRQWWDSGKGWQEPASNSSSAGWQEPPSSGGDGGGDGQWRDPGKKLQEPASSSYAGWQEPASSSAFAAWESCLAARWQWWSN